MARDATPEGAGQGSPASEQDRAGRLSISSEELTPHAIALTRTGAMVGTPLYMAPEQFLMRPTDARSDQFSFCVALHEALYGERPFAGDTFLALLEAVVAGRVRDAPPKARVPAFMRRLLLRGLKPAPADR